jgi:hypothetical protein
MTTTFPERLPFPFTLRESTLADQQLDRSGREIHYTLAGVPFRTAVTPDLPMSITTAPTQKEQQDVEPEAGENSLSGWWIRNQNSFHEGAGARYVEARGEVKDTFRFWESSNLDVWTPGQLTMLRRSVTVADGAVQAVAAIPDTTVNSVVVGRTNNVAKYTNLDTGTATTTLFSEPGTTFRHVIASETQWWAIGDVGGLAVRVYTGTLAGGAPEVWQLTSGDPTKPMRIVYAKHRLWAVNANRIWAITVAGGAAGAPVAVASIYNHPSTAFSYTDLCDAPGGVVFSGSGDGSSGLQQITLDTTGAVPTLAGAQVTAVLPNDEKILRISSLASSMILLLTNRGVRVAVASDGEMIYGPRFMERAEVPSTAKPQVVSAGRWWWLVWGDEAKVWRIDSSAEVEDGVFAYASDMESGSTSFNGITVRNERPVVGTVTGDLAYRHATELSASGYLTTGRIRYRTDEPKSFQRIATTVAPLAGTLEVVVLNDADTERSLITYNVVGQTGLAVATVPNESNPMRFASVKLNFTRAAGLTTGPTVYGVQVKALPAVKPQRMYQIPFECYDMEYWSTGQREGYDGFARDRYETLKTAEDAGAPVVLRDYTTEPTNGELCRIEEVKLVRTTQPHADKQVGSWGGILIVTLRTLS